MKEITCAQIEEAVAALAIEANTKLPEDARALINAAAATEGSPVARGVLRDLRENYLLAESSRLPICQDTGMAVIFAELGQDVKITGGAFEDAVNAGVRRGYEEGFLRKSVVSDPLRRVNTGDNTPAVIHLRLVTGENLKLTLAPKGFGCENMGRVKLLLPSASEEDVLDFVVESVRLAGSNPCPPIIVGVGLGGTTELAALLAKRALLRPLSEPHPDELYARLEREALTRINALGIGPQGFGGDTTALAVKMEYAPTHIAGLPAAVSISCHAARHAEVTL
ncbi:MAG: fumarate hydratase [Oscillospiraceae bacterium]|jgi:fumarate hydratase subunit alpha|nr:fumarate hydratase [Oscillospiraceae bacterium]